jgi:hypothetical protein
VEIQTQYEEQLRRGDAVDEQVVKSSLIQAVWSIRAKTEDRRADLFEKGLVLRVAVDQWVGRPDLFVRTIRGNDRPPRSIRPRPASETRLRRE